MTTNNAWSKDPNSVLDYAVDWSAWLGTDTIATATWTVPTGLTKASDSATTTVATVWLSGGTVGTEYSVNCRITTAGGRTEDQTLVFYIRER